MTYDSENHEYLIPELNEDDWGTPLQDTLETMDVDIPLRGKLVNRPTNPPADTWFVENEQSNGTPGTTWRYNGNQWVEQPRNVDKVNVSDGGSTIVSSVADIDFSTDLSVTDDGDGSVTVDATGSASDTHTNISDSGTAVISDTDDINFDSNLTVTDDGDGSVTIDVGSAGSATDISDDGTTVVTDVTDINFASNVTVTDDGDGTVTIDASGGSGSSGLSADTMQAELPTGEALSIGVPVADGESLNVDRWGCRTSGNTTPSGLKVQLTEPDGTVIQEENTELNANAPIVTTSNGSGSPKWYRLRVANSTGTNFVDGNSPDSVFGTFLYGVS